MIIFGDFNKPDVDWDLRIAQGQDSSAIMDHFVDLDFQQIVSSSTHVRGNILDLNFVPFCHIGTAQPSDATQK